MHDLQGFISDDALAYPPLQALGWNIDSVPCRLPAVAWEHYEVVVIRSTWDYHHPPCEFLSVLRQIQQAGTPWRMRSTS
jgi:hypothetical protein